MMKRVGPIWLLMIVSMVPNCGRIIDWGKRNFNQGTDVESNSKQVKPYIRSVTIYDELETRAIFEVLWLADEVRAAYAHLHSFRMGKDSGTSTAFLRRQLEENNHYISFYVLSTHEVKLGDADSKWTFFLGVEGNHYEPLLVKLVELPYEYQLFFGEKWNRFKVPYLIRFSAIDIDQNPIITDKTDKIHLFARSGNKQTMFTWQLKDTPSIEKPFVERKKKETKPTPKRVSRKKRK